MPISFVLAVSSWGPNGVEIGPQDTQIAGIAGQMWVTTVRQLLLFAYEGRPACMLETLRYTPDSLLPRLEGVTTVDMSREGLLLGYLGSCSAEMLIEIAGSTEFDISWLWFTSIPRYDHRRIQSLIDAIDASKHFREVPRTSEELLIMTADSARIAWLNPNRSRQEIVTAISKMSSVTGWTLDVEFSPS